MMTIEPLTLAGLWTLFFWGFFLFIRKEALDQKKADALWQIELEEMPWPHDRRRYKRRYLPFPVNYACLEQAELQGVTLTQDVGKGGIQFPAKYPLRQGTRLYLSINLPKESSLSLFGEVVWQRPRTSAPTRFDTGIKFINLSSPNITKISRHLNGLKK